MDFYYLLVILSIAVTRVLGECGRGESYSTTVKWQCGTGEQNQTNCSSLSDALNFTAQQAAVCSGQKHLNASIHLNSLTETLNNNEHFVNVFHLRLLGSPNSTVVNCDKGAALKFKGTVHTSVNIEIHNISFQKCGNGQAALFFSGNCSITIGHLVVANSNGSGLLLENVSGKVCVSNSLIKNNNISNGSGAGVHIHISQTERKQIFMEKSTTIKFLHCYFIGNKVVKGSVDNLDSHGGGMFVEFAGDAKNVFLNITNCTFSHNGAKRGAGLFASFSDNVSHNRLIIKMTNFMSNFYVVESDLYNAGGGAMVFTEAGSYSNMLCFLNCRFSDNNATWGGALALFSSPHKPSDSNIRNIYNVISCNFTDNRAVIGSAIALYCKSAATAPRLCNTLPTIAGYSVFNFNGQKMTIKKKLTASTLNIDGFPTYIKGTVRFSRNIGSPLLVRETAVVIGEQALLTFFYNTAQAGGAISLYDSWITVSSESQLVFNNNTAFMYGGAIYAHQSKELYVPRSHNCFIRYSSNVANTPWMWDSVFEFTGNKAGNKTNSIYATSIIPCVWKYPNGTSDLKATFCHWKNWSFHDHIDCTDQIATSVRNFSTTPDLVHVSPGKPKQFVVGVDDLGHHIPNLPVIPVLWPPVHSTNYTVQYTDKGVVVFGHRNHHVKVLIQVDSDHTLLKEVNVKIGGCPPGFVFSSESLSCKCSGNKRNVLLCQDRNWTASLMSGFCMSYVYENQIKRTVYGRCVFTMLPRYENQSHYILLPEDEEGLDKKFCGSFRRTGLLCGKCNKGLSIDIFSTTYVCHKCSTSAAKNWIIFLAVGGLPPLALFMAILLLHISLTGGPTNGFIFFSQVLTLSQEIFVIKSTSEALNVRGSYALMSFVVDSYSIWSLDFYRIYYSFVQDRHPLCLGERLRVIDVLALRYLSALYLFFLIVVAYFVIELHARNCRVFVCLWKPLCLLCVRFRQSWRAQTSVVDAFATFIVLSYVKLVRISLLLVTFTSVIFMEDNTIAKRVSNYDPTVDFMSRQHMPYVVLGSFFLLTFGFLPPILLLFYQFRAVQKCLNRCKMNRISLKTFMDAFQGCYKDGRNGGPDRRFFAGMYLVFRLVIFSVFNLQISPILTYFSLLVVCIIIATLTAFLQPYKIKF